MATMEQLERRREVIERIRTLERTDPHAYRMTTFGMSNDNAECGTSACLAGWAVILDNAQLFKRAMSNQGLGIDFEKEAMRILGISQRHADFMFYDMSADADRHESSFKAIENDPAVDLFKFHGEVNDDWDIE